MSTKQVRSCLKTQQQSIETLQQSIVQVSRDPRPLADARFQRHVELPLQMLKTKLIERPQQQNRNSHARNAEPDRLVPGRRDAEVQSCSFFVPDAVVVAGDHSKAIVAGSKPRIKSFATRAR